MLKPDINFGVRVPLNLDPEQGGNQGAQSVQTPQVELTDTEKETKLNQIINDIQRGNISVDEAKSALAKLGIIPEVITQGNKTVFKFEFKGKKYTVNQTSKSTQQRVMPQTRGVQSLLAGNGSETVSWLSLDQHVLMSVNNVTIHPTFSKALAVNADSTQSASGTKGSSGTSSSGGVVSADGTQSASGSGCASGVGGTGSTNGTNGTNGVVQADGTGSVSGTGSANGTTSTSKALEDFEKRIKNGEFDKVSYSPNEYNNYINTYADLLKADLKSKYNYSDNFIDSIIESAKNYALTHRNDSTIKELLTTFKDGLEQLQMSPTLKSMCNVGTESEFNLWEKGEPIQFIHGYINRFHNNIGETYFTQLFTDIFNKLELDKNEQKRFINIVFKEIANRIGKEFGSNVEFTLSDLEKLNQNGNGTYLDELFAIINEKAQNVGHMEEYEWQSATFINYDELFKSGNVNAEYIESNLDEMLLSKDPSIRKFANMINDKLKIKTGEYENGDGKIVPTYRDMSKKERQDYIKWLLVLINQENGVQYPNNLVVEADSTSSVSGTSSISTSSNVGKAKEYWTGSFDLQVTIEDDNNRTSRTEYLTLSITVNEKIEVGNRNAIEQYIKDHINEYISQWESVNPNQFITSWGDYNCNHMNQFTFYEYTQDELDNSDLTGYEKDRYFQRLNDGTYILQDRSVDADFPGMHIRSLEYLTMALNYANPSASNIYLTPNELSELGGNVFDRLEAILDSQKLDNCFKADIDSVIDDFKQGSNGTGDCWLLAGIEAINSTDAGKELLKNAIKWNSDYTAITVTFPGTGDSVTITVDELLNADPDLGSGKYNYGDNDVLALVLAYEKLYGDINGDYGDTFFKKFLPIFNRNIETTGIFEGKGLDDLVNLIGGLFGGGGGRIDLSTGTVYKYLQYILNAKNNGQNVAATFSLFTGGDTTYRWTTVDGEEGYAGLDYGGWADWGGHVFAITDITTTTVTFINPWDSSKSYTVTWSEFANIGIGDISWATWINDAPNLGTTGYA